MEIPAVREEAEGRKHPRRAGNRGPRATGGAKKAQRTPEHPLPVAGLLPIDEVDAWDSRLAPPPGSPVYFSADPMTAVADDIFISTVGAAYDAAPGIYATSAALGLGIFFGNDIGALVVIDNDGLPGSFTPGVDFALFSLAIGSSTLAPAGATAGDILIDPAGAAAFGIAAPPGLPGILFTEASLGLTTIFIRTGCARYSRDPRTFEGRLDRRRSSRDFPPQAACRLTAPYGSSPSNPGRWLP